MEQGYIHTKMETPTKEQIEKKKYRDYLCLNNIDYFYQFWADGCQHGKGIYRYSDGSYFEGNWKAGRREGYGILVE